MTSSQVTITTADGACAAHVFTPSSPGPWPGVILFMDGIGIRPALFDMASRLASTGYYVLLPDLFYRAGPYTAPDAKQLFADPELRAAWFKKVSSAGGQANAMRDTRAFLDHLAAQPDVIQPAVGVTGYCMGGALALAAAGHYPDRIVAAAAFHPGNLAKLDTPDSPHLLAPKIKARVYVAGAIEDQSFPDDMKQRLDDALTSAGVDHVIETYPARHGWVPSDTPVHDAAAAERHWQALEKLFDATLKRSARQLA
jgi:carboxymethylenebutenolidase